MTNDTTPTVSPMTLPCTCGTVKSDECPQFQAINAALPHPWSVSDQLIQHNVGVSAAASRNFSLRHRSAMADAHEAQFFSGHKAGAA